MRKHNGPDPATLKWGCSEAKRSERDHWTAEGERIAETYEVVAYTLPRNGDQYPDPDLRVRVYVHDMHNESIWAEVYVAQGVSAGLNRPNPELFRFNRAEIEDAYYTATGKPFPADIRLFQNGREWIQVGEAAIA